MIKVFQAIAVCGVLLAGWLPRESVGQIPESVLAEFRVLPYLLSPSGEGVTINWFTVDDESAELWVTRPHSGDTLTFRSTPRLIPELAYSELEESERADFPEMFENRNYKHSVRIDGLAAGTTYHYGVEQGRASYEARFETPPPVGSEARVRFITFADSETDPDGRSTFRPWKPSAQAPSSTGRPEAADEYLLTEFEGYRRNLETIRAREPDFLLISGDIVQGGGYQRAWDEFFALNAGRYGNLLSHVPLLPAIGNWENFGARNGGYESAAIAASRRKYASYFDAPPNDNPDHKNFYYRIDYGPVTVLTLDSSNGLPDSTDGDTNININASTYPGHDLPDISPGSDQWNWTVAQLKDARAKGQIIFVQFHHIPYSSGGHILPLTAEGSSGQAGIPMRVYTPLFKEYGVTAVFTGHNESFEHSLVDGIHFYDVGVAGDGLGYALDKVDSRRVNPHRVWVAHHDAAEHWEGNRLVDGGKHYGHLEVEVEPIGEGRFIIRMTPVYIFPVTDERGRVLRTERRVYDDVVQFEYQPDKRA